MRVPLGRFRLVTIYNGHGDLSRFLISSSHVGVGRWCLFQFLI